MTPADLVKRAAFRLLLETGAPAPPERIAADAGLQPDAAEAALRELDGRGSLRRDGSGGVVGSAGLSVVPTNHRIEVDGRVRWTWCALDALGILAALGRDGRVDSRSPATGEPIVVLFRDGAPLAADAVLLVADPGRVRSVVEELCPLLNLFESRETAEAWMGREGVPGTIRTLEDAAARYGEHWRALLP